MSLNTYLYKYGTSKYIGKKNNEHLRDDLTVILSKKREEERK